jgi:hypothetical protein
MLPHVNVAEWSHPFYPIEQYDFPDKSRYHKLALPLFTTNQAVATKIQGYRLLYRGYQNLTLLGLSPAVAHATWTADHSIENPGAISPRSSPISFYTCWSHR